MPERISTPKQTLSRGSSTLVSYRLNHSVYQQLKTMAKANGMSPGGYAREVLLAKLAATEEEAQGVSGLREELRTLRREFSLAARAILTVSGAPVTPEQAEEWVRKNLNR